MRLMTLATLFILTASAAPAFACRCIDATTAGRYDSSPSVVLVTVVDAREGEMPWPDKGASGVVKAYLLKVRVLKSWKGRLHSGDVVNTWTPYYGESCGCSQVGKGAKIVIFSQHGEQLDVFSCTTSEPGHAINVAKELDSIVRRSASGTHP